MKTEYFMDNSWVRSRERLRFLEQRLDPATTEYMGRIGVSNGWNCLEVGGGGGSVAEWLCQRVDKTGKVTATDINTRFLYALDYQNLEVMQHNIASDSLPRNEFDLVHCRCVLFHIPERETALRKMVQALRPGGWLLIEEPDVDFMEPDPAVDEPLKELYCEVTEKLMPLSSHTDTTFSRRLPGLIRSLGFESFGAEGRTQYHTGGTPEAKVPQLRLEQIKDQAIEAGLVAEQEMNDYISLFDDPRFTYRWMLIVSVWGRKPTRK